MPFIEAIDIALQLTIDGAVTAVPGAHVTELSLDLQRHGFSARASFHSPALYRATDDLFAPFTSLAPVYVTLSVSGVLNMPDPAPESITVSGLVTGKSVVEKSYGTVPDGPSYHRAYTIEFADIARALWTQHYPCTLLTDVTLADVLDSQKPAGVTIHYDWSALNLRHSLVCVPLDADTSEASFYDFVCWYVHTQGGVLSYDASADEYTLSERKPRTGSAVSLSGEEVASMRVRVPETVRHDVAVQNAAAESSSSTAITQDQAVAGVRCDMLDIMPVPADVDTRVALEQRRLRARAPVVQLTFATYPTVAVTPGRALSFTSDTWGRHSSWLSGSLWVYELSLRASATQPQPGHALDGLHAGYEVELTVALEEKSETYVDLPAFRRPRWPVEVEGKVVSYGGASTDRTYYVVEDETTSAPVYTVQIPLWNKRVSAPYNSLGAPGHYHFPGFRDQRVLVALWFFSAQIDRFLDYGAGTQLDMSSQGNHILFGQNEASETSLRYAYEDDKSLFEVKRVMAGDHVTWQMKEGLLYLEVRADEDASETEQTYDVTPEVEAGKSQLSSAVGGAVGDVNSKFQSGTSEVEGSISGATSEVNGALADMDSAISGQISETQGAISAATAGLSSSAGELSSAASAAASELRGKAEG